MNNKHGMVGTRVYRSWTMMIQRVTNPNFPKFVSYGGRGITVCDRWRSFENFYADMGDRPEGLTLDRIDNDGNYEPGNCRWATLIEQAQNKRPRVLLGPWPSTRAGRAERSAEYRKRKVVR
jgi:hypothetical protein